VTSDFCNNTLALIIALLKFSHGEFLKAAEIHCNLPDGYGKII